MDYYDNLNYTSDYQVFSEPDVRMEMKTVVGLGMASLLSLISLVCNGLVVTVVAKRTLLQNFPYIIIACLACIDIFKSFWYIWYVIMINRFITFHPICCKVIFFIPSFFLFLKTLCYCALALVQWAVKESLQFGEKRDVKKSVSVIILLCFLSAILSYPVVHVSEVFGTNRLTECVIGTSEMYYYYNIINSVYTYGVCTLIVVTSFAMAKRNRDKEVVDVDEEGHVMEKKEKLDKRFEIMFIIMWVLFMGTALTFEMFIRFFYMRGFEMIQFVKVYFLAIYKLFFYKGMDKNFKKEFAALFAKTSGV